MHRSYKQLTREERHVLAAYLSDSKSLRWISTKLRRSVGGLSAEITRNSLDGTREGYHPETAQVRSGVRQHDANRRNPLKDVRVRAYVTEKLLDDWAPDEIAERLKIDFPKDPAMRVSYETIYQWVASPEGRALDLPKHLRRGKPRREKRLAPSHSRGATIPHRTGIEERPSIVATRRRFGDWETDTMLGRREKGAAVSVQRERRSGFVRLTRVADKSACETQRAIVGTLGELPASLRRTLTYDNGTENVLHVAVAATLGLQTYFCDPYASWQKGGVENEIGNVRQYRPKGQSLESLTDTELHAIEQRLNNRPRKRLGYRTPFEVFSKHLKRLGVQLRA